MSIIVAQAKVGAGKIGYANLFTTSGVTVTASTEASGFDKENAYDWLGYDWWKPAATGDSWLRASFASAKAADYMAVWGHDLADHGASAKPQYSIDAGATWVDAASAVAPSKNKTLFFNFDSTIAADWRILITAATTFPVIGGVQIGEALTFPKNMEIGFAPPSLTPIVKLKTAQSESGVFLGGSKLNEGIKGSFIFTTLDPDWVRDTWQPLVDHIQTPRPFVFAWDTVTNSTEVVLAWNDKYITPAKYSDSLYMTINLDFEGTL